MKSIFNKRIEELREKIKKAGLKGCLISICDPHMSETPSLHFASIFSYFCPFKGENADILITLDKALLFVDGRFAFSSKKDVEGTIFEVIDTTTSSLSIEEEIAKYDGYPLGIDYSLCSLDKANKLLNKGEIADFKLFDFFKNLVKLNDEPLFSLDKNATSLNSLEKINLVRSKMKENNLDAYVVSDLNEVAYLTNLRGFDLPYTPVFYGFLFIDLNNAYLFINKNRYKEQIDGVDGIFSYDEFVSFLKKCQNLRVGVDLNSINYELASILKEKAVPLLSLVENEKAIKGPVEIDNIIKSQIEDGVALTKFIINLKGEVKKGSDEYSLSKLLHSYREKGKHFLGESFENIVAVDANSACMHYAPNEKNYSRVDLNNSSLLIDSGGQYKYGTTDTTRTFVFKKPSEEFKKDYTLTLKSLIALSTAIFLDGANGRSLDGIARSNMWKNLSDYKCGTGHGVSYLGPVHEGPNGFRYKDVYGKNDGAKIVPGMITTVEPGVYKEGKYGIRIENDLLCINYRENEFGKFYRFETITYVPIETTSVDVAMLNEEEIDFINRYHKTVFEKLSPYFDKEEILELKELTKPLVKNHI